MQGHITPDGTVGQLFDAMPPPGTYHPDFTAKITQLPEGVTTGWRFFDGQWQPPAPPEPPPAWGQNQEGETD